MLHLIARLLPAALRRAGLRLAHGVRVRWWRWRRPRVTGCRVIALDGAGRVLLVRHSYGSRRWMAPGGGMPRGEDAVTAAVRELAEETGARLADARLVAVVEEDLHGATNVVHVVAGRVDGHVRVASAEIAEVAFFPLAGLPHDTPPQIRVPLPGWVAMAGF